MRRVAFLDGSRCHGDLRCGSRRTHSNILRHRERPGRTGFASSRAVVRAISRPPRRPAAGPARGWRDTKPASGSRTARERFPQVFGHHRLLAGTPLLDLALGESDRFIGGGQRDRILVFGPDDSGEHAAVGRRDHLRLVIFADQGAGVEDVGEQIVEVGTIRAGQVGSDLTADAEERVALLADPGEDGAAE